MSAKKESTRSTRRATSYAFLTLLGAGGIFSLAYAGLPNLLSVSYTSSSLAASSDVPVVEEVLQEPSPAAHLPTPSPLKAIYMSQCVVGTPSFRDDLVKLIEETELNAVVIDIKDFSGKISFQTDNELLKNSVSSACGAIDMRAFIEKLHAKDIYVIGRITVFQDPYYTSVHPELAVQSTQGGVWKDNKGLAFVDVGAKPFWDYIVELGILSYELGFDELNFDYVRYPSDGPMSEALYTHSNATSKPETLEEFFKYLTEALRPTGAILSVDLFGMTATVETDMNIGQVLERALPYFDGVYPMVYPSHYPTGFRGYSNANEHAYDIVKYAMDTAVMRVLATTTKVEALAHERIGTSTPAMYEKIIYDKDKIKPWLQSFDYPVYYSPAMVREQIKATEDAGLDSWLFWDAGNKYNSLRQVLLSQ
ncbi:MAG: putative glycoside hydrolase [Candidatus Adlerbacteria bacterium]|nr:putative glycoside hydrolase [Candidatus Adlerbacteria bacterium]